MCEEPEKTVRAWIVAIENYPNLQRGLARELPGTQDAALAFRDWLISTKRVPDDGDHILVNTDSATLAGRTGGATRAELIEAIRRIDRWKDQTSELYVFLSGHGFVYSDTGGRELADVFLAAEFETTAGSGTACLRIDQLQHELRLAMGPGEHFYIVDACRNVIRSDEIDPVGLGIRLRPSAKRQPSLFTLYSTRRGATATVTSGFSDVVVSGLHGKGRAKTCRDGSWAVLFGSLKDHARKLLKDNVDSAEFGMGIRGGLMLTIAPPPTHGCVVKVIDAAPGDRFELWIRDSKGRLLGGKPLEFTGPEFQFSDAPDDYYLAVTHAFDQVVAVDEPPADLYDDCVFRFRKTSPGFDAAVRGPEDPDGDDSGPSPSTVSIIGCQDAALELRSLRDGTVASGGTTLEGSFPPGRYVATLRDTRSGAALRSEEITLESGAQVTKDLGSRHASPVHQSILRSVQQPTSGGVVEFSETIGPLADDDLGVWLAILGASRIVDDPGTFSHLRHLPLATFDGMHRGDSPLYVLAGLETARRVEVRIREAPAATALPVVGMDGLFECLLKPPAGPGLVTIRIDDLAPLTVVTHALRNRATLVVVCSDGAPALSVRQFLLPIGALAAGLHGDELHWLREHWRGHDLDHVRFMARAQAEFAHGRGGEPTGTDAQYWQGLLYAKWFDPVMAIIACYELVRRGHSRDLNVALENLREYFPGIPDIEAIAKLSGHEFHVPATPPMVLDGVLAFEERAFLPLPESHLDYGSPWTAWRADAPSDPPGA